MKQVKFNIDDVRAVAQVVVESCLYESERGRNAYLCCQHCNQSYNWDYQGKFKHEQDCVVLKAQDLLTGL